MQTVVIVIHLMVVIALVGVVLLQRSEGGALGIGGGGSSFLSARGAANALTRTTAILATAFFATSIILSVLARVGTKPTDILDQIPIQSQTQGQGQTEGGVFDQLAPKQEGEPQKQDEGPTIPSGQ